MKQENFTKYETARILGARALQISMDAPLLIKLDKEKLEELKYDPLKIAEYEFKSGILPISIKRPLPEKKESELKKEKQSVSDEKLLEAEKKEEEEIAKEGEIMELANPEDESEEIVSGENEEVEE